MEEHVQKTDFWQMMQEIKVREGNEWTPESIQGFAPHRLHTSEHLSAVATNVLTSFGLSGIGPIMDVGCGSGYTRQVLEGHPALSSMLHVDSSPAMVAGFNKIHPGCSVRMADITQPEVFQADFGKYDGVVGISSLDVLSMPDLEKALEVIFKLLKKDGTLVHFIDVAPHQNLPLHRLINKGLIPVPVQKDIPADMACLDGILRFDPVRYFHSDGQLTNLGMTILRNYPDVIAALVLLRDKPMETYLGLISPGHPKLQQYIFGIMESIAKYLGYSQRLTTTDLFHDSLSEAARKVGFQNIQVCSHTAERYTKEEVPVNSRRGTRRTNCTYCKRGWRYPGYDPVLASQDPYLHKVVTEIQCFTAEKTDRVPEVTATIQRGKPRPASPAGQRPRGSSKKKKK